MTLPRVQAAARAMNLTFSDRQIGQLEILRTVLLDWNTRINLTGITDPDEVEILHFVDSLAGLLCLPTTTGLKVIDVGTGAGIPGLVLKIARPDLELTLLESVRKKTVFLDAVVAALGFDQPTPDGGPAVSVVCGRAEDLGQDPARRESFDVAMSRALALLPVVAELCLPLVRTGGLVLAWKKRDINLEAESAARAVSILGGKRLTGVPIDLPDLPLDRQIIRYAKERMTPARYPRPPGTPAKNPILSNYR